MMIFKIAGKNKSVPETAKLVGTEDVNYADKVDNYDV